MLGESSGTSFPVDTPCFKITAQMKSALGLFPKVSVISELIFQFKNWAEPFINGSVKITYNQFRVVFESYGDPDQFSLILGVSREYYDSNSITVFCYYHDPPPCKFRSLLSSSTEPFGSSSDE